MQMAFIRILSDQPSDQLQPGRPQVTASYQGHFLDTLTQRIGYQRLVINERQFLGGLFGCVFTSLTSSSLQSLDGCCNPNNSCKDEHLLSRQGWIAGFSRAGVAPESRGVTVRVRGRAEAQ